MKVSKPVARAVVLAFTAVSLTACGGRGGQEVLESIGTIGSGFKGIGVGIKHSFTDGGKVVGKGFRKAEESRKQAAEPTIKTETQSPSDVMTIKADKKKIMRKVPQKPADQSAIVKPEDLTV